MTRARLELWERRLGQAAALLGQRLDDPPSLAELASAAAVSPFHFHRVWRAMTGETVGQSIARLRMDAAKEALAGEDRITKVAMATRSARLSDHDVRACLRPAVRACA